MSSISLKFIISQIQTTKEILAIGNDSLQKIKSQVVLQAPGAVL
jgi:hypothetical protein